jgi:hypothetical protein
MGALGRCSLPVSQPSTNRVHARLFFVFLALAACGCRQGEGVIRGTVVLQGTPPPERKIIFDALSTKLQATNHVTTRHYVVGTNGGLANVLVYVKKGSSAMPAGTRSNGAQLHIHRAVYEPYVLAVQTNQPLQLRNLDPISHTASVNPPAGNANRPLAVALPTKHRGMTLAFPTNSFGLMPPRIPWRDRLWRWLKLKQAAIAAARGASSPFIRFKCDVHPWEFGYVAVLDHPFFAITGPDGRFELPPLPAGKYTLEAVHLKAGTNTQRVTIGRGDKPVNIILNAPSPTPPARR